MEQLKNQCAMRFPLYALIIHWYLRKGFNKRMIALYDSIADIIPKKKALFILDIYDIYRITYFIT